MKTGYIVSALATSLALYLIHITRCIELKRYGSPKEETLKCVQRGRGWEDAFQRIFWNLPDKHRKFSMVQVEGMACPKVCRYAGQFTFGELQIVGHDLVIIWKMAREELEKYTQRNCKEFGNPG